MKQLEQEVSSGAIDSPYASGVPKTPVGPPTDDEADHAQPHWAGVIPLKQIRDRPVPDPQLDPHIVLPEYLR